MEPRKGSPIGPGGKFDGTVAYHQIVATNRTNRATRKKAKKDNILLTVSEGGVSMKHSIGLFNRCLKRKIFRVLQIALSD